MIRLCHAAAAIGCAGQGKCDLRAMAVGEQLDARPAELPRDRDCDRAARLPRIGRRDRQITADLLDDQIDGLIDGNGQAR